MPNPVETTRPATGGPAFRQPSSRRPRRGRVA